MSYTKYARAWQQETGTAYINGMKVQTVTVEEYPVGYNDTEELEGLNITKINMTLEDALDNTYDIDEYYGNEIISHEERNGRELIKI